MGRLCGLSTVVTPAGASINVSKDIFSRKQYKGDDDDDDLVRVRFLIAGLQQDESYTSVVDITYRMILV